MRKQDRKFLKSLLETPSPTGCEQRIAALVRQRLDGVADRVETDVMGSVHASLAGSGVAPSLMLAAHMDEIGLMVVNVSDDGFLSVAAIGGVDAAILPGLRVDVHASGAAAPLRAAEDAVRVDTSSLNFEESAAVLAGLVIDRLSPKQE